MPAGHDLVCPFCLNRLSSLQLVRACSVNPEHRKDTKGFRAKLNLFGDRCGASGCPGRYTRILCPRCEEELPGNITQYDGYTRLAITAPSGGGKTVLITTMLHELFSHSSQLGLNIGAMDRKTSAYYRARFTELYDKLTAPFGTVKGVCVPMQYYVQNTRKGTATRTPTYSLTIFDGAGEDQENPSDTETRYIAEAKMLILLIDPLKLYGLRREMTDDEIAKGGGDADRDVVDERYTQDFIDQLVSYIRIATKLTVHQKLKIPVAVVMCKMDLLRRFFPEDAVTFNPPDMTFGTFDEMDSQQVHTEIDALISEYCPSLNVGLNAVFQKWRYFGVSSYGVQPLGPKQLAEDPKPLRVMDPLMWNMSVSGIL